MDYDKVCQIYYKTTDENWTKDYNASKAKDELVKYKENFSGEA